MTYTCCCLNRLEVILTEMKNVDWSFFLIQKYQSCQSFILPLNVVHTCLPTAGAEPDLRLHAGQKKTCFLAPRQTDQSAIIMRYYTIHLISFPPQQLWDGRGFMDEPSLDGRPRLSSTHYNAIFLHVWIKGLCAAHSWVNPTSTDPPPTAAHKVIPAFLILFYNVLVGALVINTQ